MEKSKSAWFLLIVRFLSYALIFVLLTQVIKLDMYNQSFKEDSFTEHTQELLILLVAIFAAFMAYKFKLFRVFGVALSAFALLSFVREMDAFLEAHLFDKAWQTLAVIILIPSGYYIIKNFKKLINQLEKLKDTQGFGILVTGVLILHIFSRLYGKGKTWKALMGEDNFIRAVKDASEESIELLGYSIMLVGTIELFRFVKNTDFQSLDN